MSPGWAMVVEVFLTGKLMGVLLIGVFFSVKDYRNG